MGSQISCAPEGYTADCAQQALACGEGGPDDDLIQRKFLNVQLLAAARDGEATLLREALKGGANPETRQPMRIIAGNSSADVEALLKDRRNVGPTPLMLSAKSGSVDCVRHLLHCAANVDARDEDGMKPVHFAALSGELSVLKMLVTAGADVTEQDNDGRTLIEHLPDEVRKDPFEYKKWKQYVDSEAKRVAKGPGDRSSLLNRHPLDNNAFRGDTDEHECYGGMQGLKAIGITSPVQIIR